jgi:hypothetical protein
LAEEGVVQVGFGVALPSAGLRAGSAGEFVGGVARVGGDYFTEGKVVLHAMAFGIVEVCEHGSMIAQEKNSQDQKTIR